VLVFSWVAMKRGGARSQAHSWRPLRASKPRTNPLGAVVRSLSLTADPTTTTSPLIAGGEVT
jgi:hypothetical protein